MSYKLVVSEKPSVGAAYAKVLGATNRNDGYLEGNGYLVSWCIGHLVELAPPNVYDEKYVKWSVTDLPILPEKWQYLVSASTKKQFGILKKLMNRPDVESIVNSCDSGREGELIFRLVYQQAGCKKPVFRLWLSSMEENAIREGFAHLKPSTEYDALYNAALCRERADWMVGINASRLFSCLYGRPLAVGRVMTPVLAMTVVREAAIAAFVPEKFYTVDLELSSGCVASSRRISEKADAENLLAACRKEMISTIQKVTRKEKSENPPSLYDLTTLQRDANRLLGYSAQQTLDYLQDLYERELTTYPRTDSCYITDDDEEMLEELAEELEDFVGIAVGDADDADIPRTRRTVNREKVTDHHAILPTRSMLKADLDALPKGEQNILKLIIARTLMAVSKPFRYLETMLTTECAGEEFTVKGKEILEEGWKAVEREVLADILNRKQELVSLPDVEESECAILNAELKEGQTSAPKHFTEDTIKLIQELASEINEIEDSIQKIIDELNPPILSIPGMGVNSAAVILAEIGDFSNFSSPDKILAYAGCSPSTYQSGKLTNCYAHMEKRGSRYLRHALYNATKYVCYWNPVFAEYLAKKRAEGKHYNVALSHAMKKLVRLIYALQKSGKAYLAAA